MHQRYIQYHIASLCEPRSPICLLNVQKIVEATTGFSIYQVRGTCAWRVLVRWCPVR